MFAFFIVAVLRPLKPFYVRLSVFLKIMAQRRLVAGVLFLAFVLDFFTRIKWTNKQHTHLKLSIVVLFQMYNLPSDFVFPFFAELFYDLLLPALENEKY